jgi:hypothetical protein
MKLLEQVDEPTVILSWLRAETASVRFRHWLEKALNRSGLKLGLINNADLGNSKENKTRKQLFLLARGKATRHFPWQATTWHEAEISNMEDLGNLYTPFGDTWLAFTAGMRRLAIAADFVKDLPATHDPMSHAIGVQAAVKAGSDLEPPILITSLKDLSKPLCILEGNVRSLAYYLDKDTKFPIRCYIGISKEVSNWNHALETFEDIRNKFRNQ